MSFISWEDFERIDLRIGTITAVEEFPAAHKPAYKVTVDFGGEIGMKRSSAQITSHYSKDDLIGRQVIGIVNFPPKQIGPFLSECLITGCYRDDGSVVLVVPDKPVHNGSKMG